MLFVLVFRHSLHHCDQLAWGRRSWSECFSCICLFDLYVLVFVFLLVSAAVCDCGTPWTFLLTYLQVFQNLGLWIILTLYILAFMFFKMSQAFTRNSIETILGVEMQETGVGGKDAICIKLNTCLRMQKSFSCYDDIPVI